MDQGLPGAAAESIAEAAESAGDRPELWESAGHNAFQAGKIAEAIQYFEQAAALDRLSFGGWKELGQAYLDSGEPSKASQAWQVGIALHGPDADVLERLAQVRLEMGNFSGAIRALQESAVMHPEEAPLHYKLGLVQAAFSPEECVQTLDRAAELDPAYAQTATMLRRAVTSARRAEDPVYTLLEAGRALAALGEWGMAFQAFGRAALSRPDYAEAWAYLGEARQHPGEGSLLPLPAPAAPDAGFGDLQKAITLNPSSTAAKTLMALYWTRQGRHDLALEMLNQAVAQDPENVALLVQQATELAANGRFEEAQQAYIKMIELTHGDPAYRRYWIEFMLHYNVEVERLALPAARQLAVEYPKDAAVLDLMGQVFLRLGDLESAGRFLQRALAIEAESAAIHLHLGQLYLLQSNTAAARAELQQVLELEPSGPLATVAQRLLEGQ